MRDLYGKSITKLLIDTNAGAVTSAAIGVYQGKLVVYSAFTGQGDQRKTLSRGFDLLKLPIPCYNIYTYRQGFMNVLAEHVGCYNGSLHAARIKYKKVLAYHGNVSTGKVTMYLLDSNYFYKVDVPSGELELITNNPNAVMVLPEFDKVPKDIKELFMYVSGTKTRIGDVTSFILVKNEAVLADLVFIHDYYVECIGGMLISPKFSKPSLIDGIVSINKNEYVSTRQASIYSSMLYHGGFTYQADLPHFIAAFLKYDERLLLFPKQEVFDDLQVNRLPVILINYEASTTEMPLVISHYGLLHNIAFIRQFDYKGMEAYRQLLEDQKAVKFIYPYPKVLSEPYKPILD